MATIFCKPYPDRLFCVAPMPIQSVEEAVKEMRRVVKELGMKAVFIWHNPFNKRRLNDPAYDPFFFHMVCHPFEQQAACMDIVCGGVLEEVKGACQGLSESARSSILMENAARLYGLW